MIDVSRPISTNMTVWPGDEAVNLERVASISEGSKANISRIHAGVHAGTHIDAPLHFINDGKSVDQLDLNLFSGWVQIIDIHKAKSIGCEHIKDTVICTGDAVFFKTESSNRTLKEPFDYGYAGLELDAASLLLKYGVMVIGTDALSVESINKDQFEVHQLLLKNEVLLVEGLCLKNVVPGRYRYTCLPVLIEGADGAPARVVLFSE